MVHTNNNNSRYRTNNYVNLKYHFSTNEEITRLEYSDSKNTDIIRAKTIQLKVLSIAISFQYLGILFFLMSGIAGYLSDSLSFLKYLLITGVGLVTLSILLLLFYSLKAINIRQKHLKI